MKKTILIIAVLILTVINVLAGDEGDSQYNTYYGNGAGAYLDGTGNRNAFFGTSAGLFNTSGEFNTFLGIFAGKSNTTGGYNTFVGSSAGLANTGDLNTFLGYYSGNSNTTGYENTFLGSNAGQFNTTGTENIFLGSKAGQLNTEGTSNIFVGTSAGKSNTTGGYNTFLGSYAGLSNTTANYNTFIGTFVGNSNTTGYENTFLGYASGTSNITGTGNIFVGSSAGQLNTTGTSNIFVGTSAGYSNITGDENTFVGSSSGQFNTRGTYNTFLGYASGASNTSGIGNVFLGYKTGYFESGSNKLYIDNSDTNTPLIWGDFAANTLTINGALTATSVSGDGTGLTGVVATDSALLDGLDSTAFATSAHAHAGVDITSGTVAAARIDGTIARDSEIMTTVLANDGSASTLDADLLDGQDSSSYMSASTDNWVNTTGDTMTGNLLIYGDVDIDQDLYVVGNIYAESDANSKQNIQPIESALAKINHIQGISYSWKNRQHSIASEEVRHYGVIAQEVEQVLPEVVRTGKNGNKKVAYMELIPVLIEAMKEQQETITKLSEKIHHLENKLELKGAMTMVDIH